MDRRVILPLLAAAGLVFACGPLPRFGGDGAVAGVPTAGMRLGATPGRRNAARSHHARRPGAPEIDGDLAVQVPAADARDGAVHFALAVVNATDRRLEVNFPDGRTRDFAVYDAAGRELWRASRGRLFTQLVQNKLISAGDSTVYRADWRAPAPGRYAVVAELRSSDHPLVRRGEFVVPAAPAPVTVAAAPSAEPR